jgi:hypothetical protein
MKRIMLLFVLAALILVVSSPSSTAPEPAEIPTAWELDFRHDPPRPILLQVPGKARPQLFWYMRYTVTNNTGEDRIFVPDFTLYTDTGQKLKAGQTGVPLTAFDQIKRVLNAPLLKSTDDMTGKILQGADNAKDGVAIWPDFDPKAGVIDVFVGGLSGERAVVKLPTPIEVMETDAMGNRQKVTKTEVILSKALHLRYAVPGEAAARRLTKIKLLKEGAVMR